MVHGKGYDVTIWRQSVIIPTGAVVVQDWSGEVSSLSVCKKGTAKEQFCKPWVWHVQIVLTKNSALVIDQHFVMETPKLVNKKPLAAAWQHHKTNKPTPTMIMHEWPYMCGHVCMVTHNLYVISLFSLDCVVTILTNVGKCLSQPPIFLLHICVKLGTFSP